MSFTDPLSVTIAAVTTPLPRVSVGDDRSEYQSADGLILLSASHDYGKRTRRVLRIDTSKLTSDPFKPAENVKVSMSNYMVFDTPPAGYPAAEALAVYAGFKALFTASSDAMIIKLLGGES
ncbi:TPA_asm: coat protein [ssRNA phage Gephyllon.1_3]|uniref:Coat protein n=2 Tax=Leviviricetes TaxID=2842243 RepID=A0A8S5L4D9_9VIRU|nr:coat protein [ssRNA phage Gephyllon.1_3]QDH91560.1 MAG: hypothetical protein H1BulkLitter4169_000002 [Leviviridae sp.]DAD52058.1 TPA_asm: coat protein [ssRNA phage Gephyllon.1_3]